jgi:hypothetical protein
MSNEGLPSLERKIFGRRIKWGEETNNAATFSEEDIGFGDAVSLEEAKELHEEGAVLTEEKGYATSNWIMDKGLGISDLSDSVEVKLGGKVFNGTPSRDEAFVVFNTLYVYTKDQQFDSDVLVKLSNIPADQREVKEDSARFWWD